MESLKCPDKKQNKTKLKPILLGLDMSAIEENVPPSRNYLPTSFHKALKIALDKISNSNSTEENHLDGYNLVCRGKPNRGSLPLYLREEGKKEFGKPNHLQMV